MIQPTASGYHIVKTNTNMGFGMIQTIQNLDTGPCSKWVCVMCFQTWDVALFLPVIRTSHAGDEIMGDPAADRPQQEPYWRWI